MRSIYYSLLDPVAAPNSTERLSNTKLKKLIKNQDDVKKLEKAAMLIKQKRGKKYGNKK